ncbi:MAG TPA: permease prefix domain 2-containing transporter [Candidatus Acidoferrales bacterium]|nr:permease prefix domain 2-containing transporter [Candidatus Acidoferrales bacterium]
MTRQAPPRWLQRALVFLLAPRDRETVAGDLLEEYREEQAPRLGTLRANLWYLRQSVSFLSIRSAGGPPVKAALTWVSVATAGAGIWLAVMENILKHAGYGVRTAVAAAIVAEALGTLLFLVLDSRPVFRLIVLAGAAALGALGISAIARNVSGPHFEGFVLIVGCLLVAQAVMTFAVVLRAHYPKAV